METKRPAAKRSSLPPTKRGLDGRFIRRDVEAGHFTAASARHSNKEVKIHQAAGKTIITGQSSPVGRKSINPHTVVLHTRFYPKEIFDSQAEYNASVDSVVARIKSGAVKARTPDE